MLREAYGEEVMSRVQVYTWHKVFNEGWEAPHKKQTRICVITVLQHIPTEGPARPSGSRQTTECLIMTMFSIDGVTDAHSNAASPSPPTAQVCHRPTSYWVKWVLNVKCFASFETV